MRKQGRDKKKEKEFLVCIRLVEKRREGEGKRKSYLYKYIFFY